MSTVLIIEDEKQLRMTLRQILERASYNVLEAADGVEGLELFRAHQPDIVLTDIDMPNKDGIETLFSMRQENQVYQVIAMTGVPAYGKEFLRVAKQLGAETVLSKPFNSKKLLELIKACESDPKEKVA